MVTFSSAFSQFSQVADTAGSAKPARSSSKPAEKGGSSKVKILTPNFLSYQLWKLSELE